VATNTYLRKKKNVLIVSLAVSDITCSITNVIVIEGAPSGEYITTDINLNSTIITCTVFISILHILAIGIERLLAITRPLHYITIVTDKMMVAMVIGVWLTPIVIIIPGFVYTMETMETSYRIPARKALYYLCVCSYCVFTVTMCSMYGKILRDATLQANKVHELTTSEENNPNIIKNPGRKAIKLVLSILISFTVLYFPVVMFSLLKLCLVDENDTNPTMNLLEVISLALMEANSVVNVVIYAAFSREFRQAYMDILCFCKYK
jgi:hypothetical protein